ncbi:MAG: hypothetical protein Ta2E_11030 [Mycoplasmoidaceae bacterium]|nr:MAG: hypothetical protein Ta2E_11030 [Mycoplasmoidaceae bacterium]
MSDKTELIYFWFYIGSKMEINKTSDIIKYSAIKEKIEEAEILRREFELKRVADDTQKFERIRHENKALQELQERVFKTQMEATIAGDSFQEMKNEMRFKLN